MSHPRAKPGLTACILVAYAAWFITTPQKKFEVLVETSFERVLAAVAALVVLPQAAVMLARLRYDVLVRVLVLFAIMVASYLASPYSGEKQCLQWAESYWKMLVFFLLLTLGLRSLDDLAFFFRGVVYVVFFYQALTWRDFLGGGCFVYQQGIKRMVGVWGGGGYGAANGYALMSLFALPLAVWMFRSSATRLSKAVAGATIVMTSLSVFYSGSRGALLSGVLYGAIIERSRIFRVRVLIAGVVVAVGIIPLMSEKHRERFLGIFSFLSTQEGLSKNERNERDSAQSRLDGLVDGVTMGLQQPVLGYGPEGSRMARVLVRPERGELALHNLYGQVVAEIGFVGLAAWVSLLSTTIRGLMRVSLLPATSPSEGARLAGPMATALLSNLLLLLAYGVFSHHLYDFRWLLIYACQIVLTSTLDGGTGAAGGPGARGYPRPAAAVS